MSERILIRNADAVVTCDPADRVLYNATFSSAATALKRWGATLPPVTPRSLTPQASMFTPALLIHTTIFFRPLFAI